MCNILFIGSLCFHCEKSCKSCPTFIHHCERNNEFEQHLHSIALFQSRIPCNTCYRRLFFFSLSPRVLKEDNLLTEGQQQILLRDWWQNELFQNFAGQKYFWISEWRIVSFRVSLCWSYQHKPEGHLCKRKYWGSEIVHDFHIPI